MAEEIKKQIERINKLNYGLCRQINELEHDVESLQSHRRELKYGHGCSRHIRGQQKISATLQLLSSTDSATACCLINHQKGVNGQDAGQKLPKPDWMTPATYANSTTIMSSSKSKNCLGCGQVFRSLRAGYHLSFEYLVHVIEECVKYKELNLITECKECNLKFPTKRSYHHHETLVHSRNLIGCRQNYSVGGIEKVQRNQFRVRMWPRIGDEQVTGVPCVRLHPYDRRM